MTKRYKREQGVSCPGCGRPVEVGQVVLVYSDEEVHADCEHPYRLQVTRRAGDPIAYVLVGEPMLLVPAASVIALTRGRHD